MEGASLNPARRRSAAQWVCLVGGGILLVRGAVGVLADPEFESPGEGWHQLIHMLSGIVLLAGARSANAAVTLVLGFGAFYASVTLVGLLDGSDVVGVIPVQAGDNALHAVITVTVLTAGLLSLRSTPRRAPTP